MNQNFQQTDGGRLASGFIDERLDCTVRAYALAMDITYIRSHKIFEQWGRKQKGTCKFSRFMTKKHPEIAHIEPTKPRPRVKTLLKKVTLKNAIVRINSHVFCIKNNIILDIADTGQNCIVTDIWLV